MKKIICKIFIILSVTSIQCDSSKAIKDNNSCASGSGSGSISYNTGSYGDSSGDNSDSYYNSGTYVPNSDSYSGTGYSSADTPSVTPTPSYIEYPNNSDYSTTSYSSSSGSTSNENQSGSSGVYLWP